jgi:hypothetical protein
MEFVGISGLEESRPACLINYQSGVYPENSVHIVLRRVQYDGKCFKQVRPPPKKINLLLCQSTAVAFSVIPCPPRAKSTGPQPGLYTSPQPGRYAGQQPGPYTRNKSI